MSAGRIVGGILALVAGALVLIGLFLAMAKWSIPFINIFILFSLAIGVLMIVGGILGLAKVKIAGGILALIAGGISILGGLLAFLGIYWGFITFGFFFVISPTDFTYFFSLEAIIAIVGGIILLVSNKD